MTILFLPVTMKSSLEKLTSTAMLYFNYQQSENPVFSVCKHLLSYIKCQTRRMCYFTLKAISWEQNFDQCKARIIIFLCKFCRMYPILWNLYHSFFLEQNAQYSYFPQWDYLNRTSFIMQVVWCKELSNFKLILVRK